jgi:FtsP/CotA-like multicopper oxidase with cupredoxin domain
MADRTSGLDRRDLIAGLGATLIGPALPSRAAAAEERPALALEARTDTISLRPGQPASSIVSLARGPANGELRFSRGDQLQVDLTNQTGIPIALNWRGFDGVPACQPLLGQAPLSPQGRVSLAIPLRQAGTFMCDVRLLGDGRPPASAARALVVTEREAIAVDRDEILLFEDWRFGPDGTAIAPGINPAGTTSVPTVNRKVTQDFTVRLNERLRLRLINGFQRGVIAVKIENTEVRVMALDGQPSEPFPARNGAVVLAPGGRADVFIDATLAPGSTASILLHDGAEAHSIGRLVGSKEPLLRGTTLAPAPPLPSNGLPPRLELKGALRVDLPLSGPNSGWSAPSGFAALASPAFRARAGQTVILTLMNRAAAATVFHLHGHHFRLLDRLDDGWKPFWLDTLAIEPGQTQLIAFAAEHAGRWLMEATAADWAAPKLLRWYEVGMSMRAQ